MRIDARLPPALRGPMPEVSARARAGEGMQTLLFCGAASCGLAGWRWLAPWDAADPALVFLALVWPLGHDFLWGAYLACWVAAPCAGACLASEAWRKLAGCRSGRSAVFRGGSRPGSPSAGTRSRRVPRPGALRPRSGGRAGRRPAAREPSP